MSKGYLLISGNNFNVGFQLGKYWGNFFSRLKGSDIYRCYKDWLEDDGFDEQYSHLLRNLASAFPDLHMELLGMKCGVSASSLEMKVTFPGLFCTWLAETDSTTYTAYNGCSSVLLTTAAGNYLVHSDEYEEEFSTVSPLVVARVTLQNLPAKEFISISHPFQPFGSAAGMNQSFCFQGNSIGCTKEVFSALKSSWDRRIAKTLLTRKMLELDTIEEVEALYKNNPSTLPNHHFVAFKEKAYSVEVRPTEKEEISVIPLSLGSHYHANHFQKDCSLWQWSDQNKESTKRCEDLGKRFKSCREPGSMKEEFMKFLAEYPYKKKPIRRITSGSFSFSYPKDAAPSIDAELYFRERIQVKDQL